MCLRILFVPNTGAVIPHLLPLLALDFRLESSRHETAFLAPAAFHKSLRNERRNVLDIDYRSESLFRDEMAACGHFRPDVIVDDFSLSVLLTAKVANKPRITLLRTGSFPGGQPRDSAHRHSCESHAGRKFDFGTHFQNFELLCGAPAPKTFSEACAANASIIPGIRAIEELPPSLDDDPSYFFAGALSISDSAVPTLFDANRDTASQDILAFLENNRERKIVYLTLGSVLKGDESIRKSIEYMLSAGISVISTIDLPEVPSFLKSLFHYAPFVPMHVVCSRVSLMIHHCGSGTYQYAILHKVPSICIGSQCYDRDDVAYRLEELGVAKYIPANEDAVAFSKIFREKFDQCIDSQGHWYKEAKQRLELLKIENDQAAATFDFGTVLETAVSIHAQERG